jgi:toxin ParE1/3/4
MGLFTVRPLAWREINRHLDYFEEQAGLKTAERFLDRLMGSFRALADTPKMGFLCGFRKPSTRRVRRWPVKDFENWLIFYQPKLDGVEIVHVIHGACNIEEMMNPPR